MSNIVEFELVKKEPDRVIKRLVYDTYCEGYKQFPNEVEELIQEGFVVADNRLIEETYAVTVIFLKDKTEEAT